jgi:hypothetical protein
MYGIAISCCGLMPCGLAMTLSVVTSGGGGDGVDTPPAEATEIVVAATNAAKIIERMASSSPRRGFCKLSRMPQ